MSSSPPLVVAILHSDSKDIDFQLYCQAYSIEMQIDNEWNAELILLAPHKHLHAVTKNTYVTGKEAEIVAAGITDLPASDDGAFDLSVIKDPQDNWLLVGDPRSGDTDEIITKKLQAALAAGCRVIICISNTTHEHLFARLNSLAAIDCSRIVIAFVHPDSAVPNVAAAAANAVNHQIASVGAIGNPRMIVSGNITRENAADIVAIDGVCGVILLDDKYPDLGTIIEVLKTLGGRNSSKKFS